MCVRLSLYYKSLHLSPCNRHVYVYIWTNRLPLASAHSVFAEEDHSCNRPCSRGTSSLRRLLQLFLSTASSFCFLIARFSFLNTKLIFLYILVTFDKFNRVYRDISPLPSPLSSTPQLCMYVCVCVSIYVYTCMFIFVITYMWVFYICMSSIVYAVCQVFVSSYAYCVCPYYLCICMYVRIIVCSFNNVYFNVSSCNMQHKDIFLIYLNSYTCPHTPSMDVM